MLVSHLDRRARLVRRFGDGIEQIANHLVARRGHADFLALPDQGADHVTAAEGLARSWGTLHREYRLVEIPHNSHRIVYDGLLLSRRERCGGEAWGPRPPEGP